MKKHYKEEKIVLKLGLSSFNILFFSLLIYNYSHAQIPINGFCKLKSFKTDSRENAKQYTLNFNGDSYTDLFIFDKKGGTTVLRGEPNGDFLYQRKMQLPYEIDKFQTLVNRNKQVTGHAFISRKSRRVGIASVATYGTFSINLQMQLASFPEKLAAADVNKNGTQELIVSGTSYDGISLITNLGNKLVESKVVRSGSFPEITFADLSNNGYHDIAAYNITNGNLQFFYNSAKGEFRKVREIPFDGTISHLISFDMNLDGYTDLLFINKNKINIIYGDSISSYNRIMTLNTEFFPDEFVVGDFNKNGLIDIVYLSKQEGVVSFIPQKENGSFYKEVMLMKKKGLTNIIPFYSRFISGVSVYDSNGEVNTISRILSFSDDIDITLGAEPTFINGFDADNNGITDFTFIDKTNSYLYIVIRNSSGIPDLIYTVPVFSAPDRIRIEDKNQNIKYFYCFGIGNNVVEIITLDVSQRNIKRENIYVDGGIRDLRLKRASENEIPKIYVLTSKNKQLNITTFTYKDFRYNRSMFENIVSNYVAARLSILYEPTLFYWKSDGDSLTLSKVLFEKNSSKDQKLHSYYGKNINNLRMLTGDVLNKESDISLSFLTEKNKTEMILTTEDKSQNFELTYTGKNLLINEQKQLSYTINYMNGLNRVFIYDDNNNKLLRADFLRSGTGLMLTPLLDVGNINYFFIRHMTPNSNHIIYTDKVNNRIRIQKL